MINESMKWPSNKVQYDTNYQSIFGKKIPLTQGKFAIVDAEDFDKVSKHKWCAHRQPRKKTEDGWEAIAGWVERKQVKMHRFIMGLISEDKIMIDHRNHDGLDNRKENLRLCSNSCNQANQQIIPGGSSPYKGVSWHKYNKKWRATITKNGQRKEIGCFDDEINAAKAYDATATNLFGEFAELNFPEINICPYCSGRGYLESKKKDCLGQLTFNFEKSKQ